MWEEAIEAEGPSDWTIVALRGGAARLRLPVGWRPVSRDDGGLAWQSPGPAALDLLVSLTTYRNPYGVRTEEAIQYLDRENVLPHGIAPIEDEDDGDRRWIAYAVAQPPDGRMFVWKVADFSRPGHVRVVTVQLLVPFDEPDGEELAELLDRLGEEAARIEFAESSVGEPVERVTMRNVGHGDLVRFRLPWDWQETAEGELAVFFRKQEGSGTLRVAVHAFPHAEKGADAEGPARVVLRETARQFADGPDGRVGVGSVEYFPDGEVMARFVTEGEEDGERMSFHLWLRGIAAEGQTTLALFSFALAERSKDTDRERQTLAMLEKEIRAAVVGAAAGDS